MDVARILAELREQREQIDQAILSLQRLAGNSPKRGRPPAWMAEVQNKKRGRPPGSKNKKHNPDGTLDSASSGG